MMEYGVDSAGFGREKWWALSNMVIKLWVP
jgi:hypothetical protein